MKIHLLFLLTLIVSIYANTWIIGAGSRTLIPPVNGRTDYVKPVSEFDATSPGTFVKKFDHGEINVGNGDGACKWVRDDFRVNVIVLKTLTGNTTLIVLSADVYMIFRNDFELYFDAVRKLAGTKYGNIEFIGHANHNHEGPDTAGMGAPVNHKYYDYMLKQFVDATMEALQSMEPATVSIAETEFAFGVSDSRDPRILDKKIRILQAKSRRTGKVISTMVQWTVHPEVTLGFSPTTPDEDCKALNLPPGCSSKGKYFSGDFPGILQRIINQRVGGNVVYMNGCLGILIAPWGPVWEVSDEFPITGDGSVPPPNAPIVPKSFRKTYLIGRELANRVLHTLATNSSELPPPRDIIYKKQEFYSRGTNAKFQVGLSPNADGTPRMLGHTLRKLYTCPIDNPNDETCVFDNYEFTYTTELGLPLPMRKGEWVKTEVVLVQFGETMAWITVPGEAPPEFYLGLPPDFGAKYFQNPHNHEVENYTLPFNSVGLEKLMKCKSCWVFGLANDELGYFVPMSDWRQCCIGGSASCQSLPMKYKDAMSGEECYFVMTYPEKAKAKYGDVYDAIYRVCKYGQICQVANHYEETNSGGWNLANDYFRAALKLLK